MRQKRALSPSHSTYDLFIPGEEDNHLIAYYNRARATLDLPPGLDHSLSLYITPASLDSILNSPLPSSARRKWRQEIPFVVAVSSQAAEEPSIVDVEDDVAGAGWRGYFNVAVESLLDSFFSTVAGDSRTPFELGGHVSGEDIYCDHTRWGIHEAGVGYRDRRGR